MTANSHEQLWTSYLKAYGPIATSERQELLERSVADDVQFTNPAGEGKTRDGLIQHIEDFQKQMPGAYFETDRIFCHHGELLAVWSMYKKDGSKVATGYNFIRRGHDGRFSYMAGFF